MNHILIKVAISDHYKDVHPDLILEDFINDSHGWDYSLVDESISREQALREALQKAIQLAKDLHQWEQIEAETSYGKLWIGHRNHMPPEFREISNQSGIDSEKFRGICEELETALNQGKEKES